jgi:uncharacterized protein (TIGR03435 family)
MDRLWKRLAMVGLTAILSAIAHGQESFEVASFKLVASGPVEAPPGQIVFGPRTHPLTLTGTRVTAETSLEEMLLRAFDLPHYDLKGPGWLGQRRYRLEALVPAGTSRSQLPPMLRQLLIERLGLRTHWEERPQSVQLLLVAATGHQLTEAPPVDERQKRDVQVGASTMKASSFFAPGQFFSNSMDLDALARAIRDNTGEPVINQTGLDKKYSIDVRWTPSARDGFVPGTPGSDAEFPRALLKQLGLRLEKRRITRKVLVVDHADLKPVEN